MERDWRQEAADYATSRGLAHRLVPRGIGIDFADRCDAFWVLPGEITSTVLVRPDGSVDLATVIAEFERVENLRERTQHVVRHYLASKRISIDKRPSGEWGIMTEEGSSSELYVGALLTARAMAGMDIYALIAACFKGSLISHPPSPRRIDRYLAMEGPPADERTHSETPAIIDIKYNLESVLRMSGICRALDALDKIDRPPSPEQLAEVVKPKGPLGKTLWHIAERLPEQEASYALDPKSKQFVERVRSLGIQAAGDEIVEEYRKLNVARSAVLTAVKHAAGARQWSVMPLGGNQKSWHLGKTQREAAILIDDGLTDALRELRPDEALRRLLSEHLDFAEECAAYLGKDLEPISLQEKDLSPRPPIDQPPLRDIDEVATADLDAFADRTIADYFGKKEIVRDYGNRDIFDPLTDDWAKMSDWIAVAERHIGDQWPSASAILVLLDAGDSRGEDLARKYLEKAELMYDVSDFEMELAWRFRHALPDVAHRCFLPEPSTQVPFAELRARLGDPVAQRFLATNRRFNLLDEYTWTRKMNPLIAGIELGKEERQEVRQHLLEWARDGWQWSPPSEWQFRAAIELGLHDVADALDANPFLRNGLLCRAQREGMCDEPGILFGGNAVLLWSKLKPTELLARIIATVHYGDILAQAEQVNREGAERNHHSPSILRMTLGVLGNAYRELQMPLAIAWKRYRSSKVRHVSPTERGVP
jgi:hypothetical protein